MIETKKYLDYGGLGKYHQTLVRKMTDLEYSPLAMFDSKIDLVNKDNWGYDKYGRVTGLKKGLIITVSTKFWQLEDPEKFRILITQIGTTLEEKANHTPEEMGWKIVGNTTDFEVDGHALKLIK